MRGRLTLFIICALHFFINFLQLGLENEQKDFD